MDDIAQTLFIGGTLDVFQVPPVSGQILSGNWRLDARIAENQRMRIMGHANRTEVHIESRDSGTLFAVCPVPHGKRLQYVHSAADSSRNFVIRVEDKTSGQHAWIGISFSTRQDAFDFNVALTDEERRYLSAKNSGSELASVGEGPGRQNAAPAAPGRDLSLAAGEVIKVDLKGKLPARAKSSAAKTAQATSTGLLPPPKPVVAAPSLKPLSARGGGAPVQNEAKQVAASPSPPSTNASSFSGWAKFD